MLTLIISLLIPICLVIVFRFINTHNKSAIYGIYQQKDKYYDFKFLFMYFTLTVRQVLSIAKRRYAVLSGKSDDGNIQIHKEDYALEQKFHLGDYPLAVDAVYFNGVSRDNAVICGLARRSKQNCDSFLYIKLGDDLLTSPKLPDTRLTQTECCEYKVEGIEIVNVMPMRSWKLYYNGEMKSRNNPEKRLKVEAEFTWSALWNPFNFDCHMSPRGMARDVAREKWSKDYFKLLKKFHQTHYEQMGTLEGTVTVDGKEHTLELPCVRDHSFGKYRDWRNFHRYVLHFFFLDNGDYMAVGVVSQPAIISHLTIGYVCKKGEPSGFPVVSSDFKLYQHGENGVLPKDYGFSFIAGRIEYTAKILVEDEAIFYIGEDRDAKLFERWATVEVNGIKGRSCQEWQFRNVVAK